MQVELLTFDVGCLGLQWISVCRRIIIEVVRGFQIQAIHAPEAGSQRGIRLTFILVSTQFAGIGQKFSSK